MTQTETQYHQIIAQCRDLFLRKARDYGVSWAILRMPSVTDQIYIKAERIRSLQQTGINRVGESEEGEFVGIVNYCVIALLLLDMQGSDAEAQRQSLAQPDVLANAYDQKVKAVFETMQKKNHDYGEAWRKMRVSSMTDLILMKILRLKQIEDNAGLSEVSEGPDANYTDILNYAVFCLIRMQEQTTSL